MISLLSAVSAITFTNFAHGLTKVAIDFPQAKVLADLAPTKYNP